MRIVVLIFEVVCAVFISMCPIVGVSLAQTHAGPSVGFLNPNKDPDHTFWGGYTRSMQAAAADLDIPLFVNYHGNRFELQDALEEALTTGSPDYLVSILYRSRDEDLLNTIEKANIGILIGNTDLLPEEKTNLGVPGGKFKNWVGHIVPDDYGAGRDLTRELCAEAIDQGLVASDGKVHMIGLGGGADSVPAKLRADGMMFTLKAYGNEVVLDQYVFTAWKEELAYDKTLGLLSRYPETNVIWAVSDEVAKGVLRAVSERGRSPGKDILIGSIDGSKWSLEALRKGELNFVIGGHFLEGAFALVYLYDLYNGYSPLPSERMISMPMYLFTRKNLHELEALLDPQSLAQVDFKVFTKTHGQRGDYSFSVEDVLNNLRD